MIIEREKPHFRRQVWDRHLRLGKKSKKKRHWRAAKGGSSRVRLKERGAAAKPTIGWGSNGKIRGKVEGFETTLVMNVLQLEKVSKKQAIIIASVGKKKRMEIIEAANKKGIKILNKYKEKKNEA